MDKWSPDSLSAVGAASTARANAAAEAKSALGGLSAFDSWQGAASTAAQARTQIYADGLGQHGQDVSKVATAANTAANEVRQVKSQLSDLRSTLGQYGITVDANGSRVVPPTNLSSLPAATRKLVQDVTKTGQQALDQIRQAGDHADRLLADALGNKLTEKLPQKCGGGESWDTSAEIPVDKSPEEVKKWWDSLPPDKQNELRDKWPEKLGNLNGIPIVDRNKANRKVWDRDLHLPDTIAASRGVTRDEVLAHPELYGLAGPTMDRYKNACKIDEAFRKDADATDAHGKTPEAFLVKYDPEAFGGKGSAAIALGNPDEAKNTTVMVSGFTTSVAGGTMADGSAVNVYNEANRADPHNSTAVMQWMGYDAPGLDLKGVGVAEPFMARDGAQILAADVNALGVTHVGEHSHTTVIGHSYGSTTVADAAAGYGMRADDVVLVGCPGTDLAKSAADFHLPPGGHLYVGAASSDPVTNFGREHINVPGVGLGADPAMDGYGSTRFHAEVPGVSINPIHDHSEYFTDGSESLFSIGDIASGHGDALEHDGMTAGHRQKTFFPPIPGSPIPPVVDPELPRIPHNDHRHTVPAGS
ncbi:hypothetical protein BOO86_14210 [Mycobacterium sp. CBMA 234]|nr:hypothetical protein [Mycolicibacterium sp. CBMA 234]